MQTFEEICKNNYERIYKYIFCLVRSHERTEDITQEVFLVAFQRGEEFLEHENPTAFLYRTAKNLTYAWLRKSLKEMPVDMTQQETGAEEYDGDLFEVLCQREDVGIDENKYVDRILNKISEQKRKLYYAYYVEHKPMKQIADEAGLSEGALRMKYVRLRREIKHRVKELRLGEF